MGTYGWPKQWFQVNLDSIFLVTGIATQGDPNQPPNYAYEFSLLFSFDGLSFTTIRQENDNNVEKVISSCLNFLIIISLFVSTFAMPTGGYYFFTENSQALT